jgi:uncharacterized protein (DUF433 family)
VKGFNILAPEEATMSRRIEIINRGRGPELAGMRITVFDLIPYLRAGHSPTYIAAILGLSTPEVLALMQYIEEHKEEVMAENQKIEERIARGNPPEIEALREQSHAKLLAYREELRRKKAQEGANGACDPE